MHDDANQVQVGRSELMTAGEVAAYLKIHLNTLRRWEEQGIGPRPVVIGVRSIRYRRDEVEAYARTGEEV